MSSFGRLFGLREGVEDAGAAQDAIGELRALFEKPQSDDQVKWFLLRWFRDNEDSIKGALGLGGEPSQEDGADASAGVQLGPK